MPGLTYPGGLPALSGELRRPWALVLSGSPDVYVGDGSGTGNGGTLEEVGKMGMSWTVSMRFFVCNAQDCAHRYLVSVLKGMLAMVVFWCFEDGNLALVF
jgi:hypothetical protein